MTVLLMGSPSCSVSSSSMAGCGLALFFPKDLNGLSARDAQSRQNRGKGRRAEAQEDQIQRGQQADRKERTAIDVIEDHAYDPARDQRKDKVEDGDHAALGQADLDGVRLAPAQGAQNADLAPARLRGSEQEIHQQQGAEYGEDDADDERGDEEQIVREHPRGVGKAGIGGSHVYGMRLVKLIRHVA